MSDTDQLMDALLAAANEQLRNPQMASALPIIIEMPAAEIHDWRPTPEQVAAAGAGILVVPQELQWAEKSLNASPTLADVGFHRVEWRDD